MESSTIAGGGLDDYPSPVGAMSSSEFLNPLSESWEAGPVRGATWSGDMATMAENSNLEVTSAELRDAADSRHVMNEDSATGGPIPDPERPEFLDEATRVGVVFAEEGLAVEWTPGVAMEQDPTAPFAYAVAQADGDLAAPIPAGSSQGAAPESMVAACACSNASLLPTQRQSRRTSSASEIQGPLPENTACVTASLLRDGRVVAQPSSTPLDTSATCAVSPAPAMVAHPEAGQGLHLSRAGSGGLLGRTSSQDLLLDWLRREASRGDEEAQFHLAQLFSPPRFELKTECRECGEPFGVTRYRHHCRHCGGSFCHEHSWHVHPIPKLGLPTPQVSRGQDERWEVLGTCQQSRLREGTVQDGPPATNAGRGWSSTSRETTRADGPKCVR